MMVSVVLATHGRLGEEILGIFEQLMGSREPDTYALHLEGENQTPFRDALSKLVQCVSSQQGILILTDMFGGTPMHVALSFLSKEKIEVISGLNLPLLMKVFEWRKKGLSLRQMVLKIEQETARLIQISSQMLEIPKKIA
ncbi:MAG: PTS sugar transporter subunit IIA [Alphaproteobacteria bacterium]